MLYQIDIKILLKNIYTREYYLEFLEEWMREFTENNIFLDIADESHMLFEKMSLREEYKKLNQLINTSAESIKYKVIYIRYLSYVVPFAFQDEIVLSVDILGKVVNNVFSDDEKYCMQSIRICVFPLELKTLVLVYRDKKAKRYLNFEKQFAKLSEDSKLAVINYVIFLYSENYLISNAVDKSIFDSNLAKCSEVISSDIMLDDDKDVYSKEYIKRYRLDRYDEFENLLSEYYSLNNKTILTEKK